MGSARKLAVAAVVLATLSCGSAAETGDVDAPLASPAIDGAKGPRDDTDGVLHRHDANAPDDTDSVEDAPDADHTGGAEGAEGADGADGAPGGCRTGQVDVNRASASDLERIVHIGSARAEQVGELRPFVNVRGLTRVPGIAEKRLSDIVEQDLACAE